MLVDLIVIGSGPGGQKAALQGAKAGKKVLLVESYPALGGGCVHWGTLPSKSFRESVYRYSLGSRGALGSELSGRTRKVALPDMKRLLQRRDRVITAESEVIGDQFERNHVIVKTGHARLVSPNEVEITSRKGIERVTGAVIILAPGARPVAPAHIKVDGKLIHDSNTILTLKKLPKTIAVLGGGIIGCEYASMFATAGSKVFLVDRRHEILASVDREIVGQLVGQFESLGMEIILEAQAQEVAPVKGARGKARVKLSSGRKLTVDAVLVAQGRAGNTENLGLETVGITPDERGLIAVDAFYRTAVPNIYAVGDVVGAPALASTSMEQGRIACCHAFGFSAPEMSPLFPYGIYTIPEISMVGPSEEQLRDQKVDFVVGRGPYREMARGEIVGDRWGLLKLLVDRKSLKLLGVHILGDSAADLVHIGQAVMAFDGDVRYFVQTVFNYPTLAEVYKAAAFNALNQIDPALAYRSR